MTKPIIAAARQLASQIHAQEDSLDQTLAGQAKLISDLVEARRATGAPAALGADVVDKAILALTQCGELRRTMLDIHASLAGMNIRAIGDTADCPEEYTTRGSLRVVEAEAGVAANA